MCRQIIKQVKTNTFSQIYIQVVFAVKGRASLVSKSWEEELYKFVSGIVTNKGQKLLAINGMPDHIHIFIAMKPTCCLSDLVREIKKASNVYINEKKLCPSKFQWQQGFGAFSYSQSSVRNVISYILKQKEHHKKKTFKEEYIEFLRNFEIEYKTGHLFEWID